MKSCIECRGRVTSCSFAVSLSGRRSNIILRARNPYKEAQLDMISGGTPNTPVRRLSYTIKRAISLQDLSRLIKRNRQKMTGGVWLDKHEAAVLARAADLGYATAMQGAGGEGKSTHREALEDLMELSAHRSLRPPVIKLLEGRTIVRLLSSLARAECTPSRLPMDLLTSLVLELTRVSGNKLPQDGASMAELYWCIAVLGLLLTDDKDRRESSSASDQSYAPGPRDSSYRHRHHHLLSPNKLILISGSIGSSVVDSTWMELDRCALFALQQEALKPKMVLEDLSKMSWAISTMGRTNGLINSPGEDLMGYIEKISLQLLDQSSTEGKKTQRGFMELEGREARTVANLAYAFAKGGRKCPQLMARLSQIFTRHLSPGSDGQEAPKALPSSSRAEAEANSIPSVSGSSIAKMMWAMASLGHKDSSLIQHLSSLIISPSWLSKLHLTGDELAHITWSLSALQHHKPQVFEALGRAFVGSRMYGASDRQLAMISSSFVPLASSPSFSSSVTSGVYRTISRLASGRASTMDPEDLVTIAWALVAVKEPNALLLEVATKAATSSLHASPSSHASRPSLKPNSIARLTSALQQSKETRLLRDLTSALHVKNMHV